MVWSWGPGLKTQLYDPLDERLCHSISLGLASPIQKMGIMPSSQSYFGDQKEVSKCFSLENCSTNWVILTTTKAFWRGTLQSSFKAAELPTPGCLLNSDAASSPD